MNTRTFKISTAVLLVVALLLCLSECGEEAAVEHDVFDSYLASKGEEITLYRGEQTVEKNIFGKVKSWEWNFTEAGSKVRGTNVVLIDDPAKDMDGNILYDRILLDGEEYFISPEAHVYH